MLKINLLPAYIYERRKVRRTMIAFGMIFLLTVGGVAGWWVMLINRQKALNEDVIAMEANANRVTALEGQIATAKSVIASTQAKTDYIEAVMQYNLESVKLYENLAKYTYSRILYTSVTPSGGRSVAIQAHARTLGDCGRYLLNMYRATSIFSGVTITGVPGWDPKGGAANGFDFTVTGTLVKPIIAPTYASGVVSTPPTTGVGMAAGSASTAPR